MLLSGIGRAWGYIGPSDPGGPATCRARCGVWWFPVALRLAWRNLARDRTRLIISVIGVSFSVFLMAVQLGLLIGFAITSSSLVDRSNADFWIVPHGTTDVDQAGDLPYDTRYKAEGIPGVAGAESVVLGFVPWKTPTGGIVSVIVVGVEPDRPGIVPWKLVSGSIDGLRYPDGVIVDELYAAKLGLTRVGQTFEISDRRVRVVALTSGVRTFTQSPYIFASFKTASRIMGVPDGRTTYTLVRASPGRDLARMQQQLEAQFPHDDIWTRSGFAFHTCIYWLFTTGAGTALCIAAVLGFIVGIVIVAQTLYAATVERTVEYATLRAIGATDRFIRSVILRQALTVAVLGYGAGLICAAAAVFAARNASAALILPWWLSLALFFVTAAMCASASLFSIRKVLALEPANVFR